MKTFNLNHINAISDFQFLSDSSGFVQDSSGNLYHFQGNHTQLIKTPNEFKISAFHFIDNTHGAIIGNAGTLKNESQKASLAGHGIIVLLLLFFFLFLKKVKKFRKSGLGIIFGSFSLLLVSGYLVSCGNNWQLYRAQDPNSEYSTFVTSKGILSRGPHSYIANKGLTSFISMTSDGGKTWQTFPVPTNFHLTTLTSIGNNYYVGTFANEKSTKKIPYHGCGDVYIYGNDSSFSKELAKNTFKNPLSLYVKRGVKGFLADTADSVLYVFGSDTEPDFPREQIGSTPGNITVLSTAIKPTFQVIDTPGEIMVCSLSRSQSGELWVTTDNKTPKLVDRTVVLEPLKYKKLLCFRNGVWDEITVNGCKSFNQVEFVMGTDEGYTIGEKTGEMYETTDG